MDLLLGPTVIANKTQPDDYCVIHDGRGVGRLRLAEERSWQGSVWSWHINPPLTKAERFKAKRQALKRKKGPR